MEEKEVILESMKTLIKDGESLCSGERNDFTEFAQDNGFDLDLVKEVYSENEDELQELYNEVHEY
jgi:hypothetical protein